MTKTGLRTPEKKITLSMKQIYKKQILVLD